MIKSYFRDLHALRGSMTVHLGRGEVERFDAADENWWSTSWTPANTPTPGPGYTRLEPWLNRMPSC